MKYFYIIRFHNENVMKIGITKNLNSRLTSHYWTYRDFDLDLNNIEIVQGSSKQIRVLESYIKAKFEHSQHAVPGHTELFDRAKEPAIVQTVHTVCVDLGINVLQPYGLRIEKRIIEIVDYHKETLDKVQHLCGMLETYQHAFEGYEVNEREQLVLKFSCANLSLEQRAELYGQQIMIQCTFDTGFRVSYLINEKRLLHDYRLNELVEFFESEGITSDLSSTDPIEALRCCYRIDWTLALGSLYKHYPEYYALLPQSLREAIVRLVPHTIPGR